ncbi:MAG TPA: transposase [Streptosporangiaceae bacterium]|nr:transposase [Streptosporangiaceae bacterium]
MSCTTIFGSSTPPRRSCAVFFHQGAPPLREGTLRTDQGIVALRAAAACHLSPAGQLQVATALDMLTALEARLHMLRHELGDAARHLTGAKTLAARLYGVGPVTALAITCWLAGADRFSSSRKAVRFTGLDITVYSSDGKRSPGHLSRQGPPVLRWAVYEAARPTPARLPPPPLLRRRQGPQERQARHPADSVAMRRNTKVVPAPRQAQRRLMLSHRRARSE